MILANPTSVGREFMLPAVAKGLPWRLFLDTAAKPPYDIYPEVDGPAPVSGTLALTERSMRCYVATS
jgi:glycogen operon protein